MGSIRCADYLKIHYQIQKEEVDYPVRYKKKALKDIALYPPRIVLEIRQRKSTTPDLQFDLKVEGIRENITLNVFIPSPAAKPCSMQSSDSSSTSSSGFDDTSSHRSSSSDNVAGSDSTSGKNVAGSDESSVSISPQTSSGYFSSQDSEEGRFIIVIVIIIIIIIIIIISSCFEYFF